jgi:peroxiredoxin
MNYDNIRTLKKLTLTGIFLSFLVMANSAFSSQKTLNVGPEIGSQAPKITVLNDQLKSSTIKNLSENKGLIILFFRSADWCPFCKKHLIELNGQAEKFTSLGYGLAAISYDSNEILQKFTKQQSISYPLLSDQKAKTILAYGILNKQYQAGDDNYGIPYPGVVVIDNTGKVTHTHFFEGYKNRVKFTELYEQLK